MNKLMLLLPLFLFGCGDNDFRKVEKLEGFRILAIEAAAPEVAPNSLTNLKLFMFDSVGRIVNGTVTSCIDPGIALGAPVSCELDPAKVTNAVNFSTIGFDRGVGEILINPPINVPATILAGRSSREQSNGVAYIAIINFFIDGKNISAFKRIIATTRSGADLNTNPNQNPAITKILLNNLAFSGFPQKGDTLTFETDAPQTYPYINVDNSTESRREEFQVAWFMTEGEFDKPKSGVSEAVEITKDTPQGSYLILGIVRDDRGGVTVVRQNVGP